MENNKLANISQKLELVGSKLETKAYCEDSASRQLSTILENGQSQASSLNISSTAVNSKKQSLTDLMTQLGSKLRILSAQNQTLLMEKANL